MTNTLCAPTCFGFPSEGASGTPTSPVICKAGDLVVKSPKIRLATRQGTLQSFAVGIASGQSISGAALGPTYTNPFDVACLVIAHHEFGMSGGFADADWWGFYGDISISGGTLYSGGTSGQFQLEGIDGRNFANDDHINARFMLRSYTMLYSVGAGASFQVNMLARLEARSIRGAFRSIGDLSTAQTVDIQPVYP